MDRYYTESELSALHKQVEKLEKLALYFATEVRDIMDSEFSQEYMPSDPDAKKWYKKQLKLRNF